MTDHLIFNGIAAVCLDNCISWYRELDEFIDKLTSEVILLRDNPEENIKKQPLVVT